MGLRRLNQMTLNMLKLILLEDMEGYRAFDEYEGIEVAWNQVKLHDFLQKPEDMERLYCEIHLLKTLKHENIMKLYTSWVDIANRNINFVTEMFTSGTLRQYRVKHKKVNIRAVKHWCRQILKGLLYLHSCEPPVIHRDLKCDNIFVNGNQGEIKIGDLGLAAILRKSHAARCVGTPEFMAPEVYEEEYNELVDIYAFGMCILEMVTFEYPYSECTHPAQIYKKVISGKKPEALYKVKDPEVRQFVEKCLATVPCRLTAMELLKDPFLLDDSSDSRPLLYLREYDELGHPLQPPTYGNDHQQYASYSDYVPQDDFDYNPLEFKMDEHLADVDITIKGSVGDDDGIFLRLRIADKDGRIRNIYFPFDIKSDTALSVATEMVAELDFAEQDVMKIAEMIDGEIAALVPEWNQGSQGLGAEEVPEHASENICNHCTPNGYLLDNASASKNLQVLKCSKHGCAAVHGRFEEVTYQVEGREQCAVHDPQDSSGQSDDINYTDIWAQRDGWETSLHESREIRSNEAYDLLDDQPCEEEEKVINIDRKGESKGRKSSSSNPPASHAFSDDYENEIRQELRWLKARYQIQLRQLTNQQMKVKSKSSGLTSANLGHRKKSVVPMPPISPQVRIENSEHVLAYLASKKHLTSGFAGHADKSHPDSPEVQMCGAIDGSLSPDEIITAKSFYTGVLLPHSLQRATSLPVDAVDV
ncbi:probable serine/threonine-protein kinase WNK9 isoform X2 [Tripterygium wilfordii]|uniref:probable serine/threonine-protein kinase WNK9 isoform X2 n=1 Tax=Tripterygium wilfordii TaxID=458696 RepID=UPI0018F84A63|nr:probable serine/threonine-protein kinase WNK9 isoform X2 [Tripterygium wilfordii]